MSKEAMKLALEALELHGNQYPHMVKGYCLDAIAALKQALEQPEPEPVAWAISYDGETPYTLWDGGDCALLDIEVQRHGGKARKMPLYASPPKREPEPVIDKSAAIRIATSLGWTPQRKPLTDEQLWGNDQIMSLNADLGWHMDTIRMFARAIEAAHGIKEDA